MRKKKIVITGIGMMCSLGMGKKEVWQNILNRKTGVILQRVYARKKLIGEYYLHKARKFKLSKFINDHNKLNELEQWKRGENILDLDFMLASIALAIKDAKIVTPKDSTGLVITHENPGLEPLLDKIFYKSFSLLIKNKNMKYADYFFKLYDFIERSAYETQSFMFLHHASKIFDIHGYSLFINNACASGLYAIEAGAQTIHNGRNDMVIVAASDAPRFYKYLWLKKLGLYAEDGKIKPFSLQRNGFVFGDGGSALILEEYEHARKRKARIYAEYLGGGFSLESWKVTLPAINKNYYQKAITNALLNSNLSKSDIHLINAHGLGTNVSDQYESRAIRDVFGKKMPYVTAFKPYIGHNLGGCALLETVLLVLSLEKKIAPQILDGKELDIGLGINILTKNMSLKKNCIALKLSNAFGGYNGAIILKKYTGNKR